MKMTVQKSLECNIDHQRRVIELTGLPDLVLTIATDIFQDIAPSSYDEDPHYIYKRYAGQKDTRIPIGLHMLRLTPIGDLVKLEYVPHIEEDNFADAKFQLFVEGSLAYILNKREIGHVEKQTH